MADHTIQVGTARFDMTPYYMGMLACDIFRAAQTSSSDSRRPWYKYFLYCVAIEIGLKATLLNNNNTHDQKQKNKAIGHDLTLPIRLTHSPTTCRVLPFP